MPLQGADAHCVFTSQSNAMTSQNATQCDLCLTANVNVNAMIFNQAWMNGGSDCDFFQGVIGEQGVPLELLCTMNIHFRIGTGERIKRAEKRKE